MKIYSGFAALYDALMHDVPYDGWTAQIDKWIHEKFECTKNKIVVDLGCGTGNVAVRLAKMGYSVIGVDNSADMLGIAYEKAASAKESILFINQDIRELDLYGTVDVVVSFCDVMNYMLTDECLQKVFGRVHLFLNPGGLFIFDMNTAYKYKDKLGTRVFVGTGTGGEAYVWENKFCGKTMINEYNVRFFDTVNKTMFNEKHLQKAYDDTVVTDLLKHARFNRVETKCGYTDQNLNAECIRAVYIAQK